MILSDRELRARLEDGSIGIEPLEDLEAQLQPASFDLRLDRTFRRLSERGDSGLQQMAAGAELVLRPGDFALSTTYERVRVPPELAARVEGAAASDASGFSFMPQPGSSTLDSRARLPSSLPISGHVRCTSALVRVSARSCSTR